MLLDDIAAFLVTNTTLTVGGTTGTLAKAILTDQQPDTVAVLFEQAGFNTALAFSTGTKPDRVYEQPGLQVLSRSTSYQTARNAAETVYDSLDGVSDTTVAGTRYLSIEAVQPPFGIGRDHNERYMVSCNFRIKRATVSAGNGFDSGFDSGFS